MTEILFARQSDVDASAAQAASASAALSAAQAALNAAVTSNANGGNLYVFDTSTTMGLPATGKVRANNAVLGSATALAFNYLANDTGNPSIGPWIVQWGASTNTVKGYVILRKFSAPQSFMIAAVTGTVDNATWVQVNINNALTVNGGSFAADDILLIQFARAGDQGGGVVGQTNHAVVVASGATTLGAGVVLGSGQLLIGAAGADPTAQTLSGDATITAGGALTIANDAITTVKILNGAVTYAKIQNVSATSRALGRITAGAGVVEELTGANLTTIIGGNLTTLQSPGNWKVFYTDGSAVLTGVALGAAGTALVSTGTTSAPTAQAVLQPGVTNTLTVGYTATSFSGGTITGSNQTYTPVTGNGGYQAITLNGSSLTGTFTFAVPAAVCTIVTEVVNGGSGAVGAALSTSGYTKVTGDTFTTTNGHKFLFYSTKTNSVSHLHIQAMQ